MEEKDGVTKEDAVIETIRAELAQGEPSRKQRIREAIALAALGSVPWVGGVLVAAAAFKFDESGVRQDSLRTQWLLEHHQKLRALRDTLEEMLDRVQSFGEEIEERLESKEYLGPVRKAFREWDEADTEEKRRFTVHLITNAAGTRLCSDDILHLFLDWIDSYHEAHFAVIREIHKGHGPTRYDIWTAVYGPALRRAIAFEIQ